jgi:PIN domain nuclease of toxin-antitoxin system
MSIAEPLVLDTHVWVAVAIGRPIIAPKVVRRIDAASAAGLLHVAAITLWEVARLAVDGKLKLGRPTLEWIRAAVRSTRVEVIPLLPEIAVDSTELPAFHGDPADRMIVATARHLGATLVTRDGKILDYGETRNVRVLEP